MGLIYATFLLKQGKIQKKKKEKEENHANSFGWKVFFQNKPIVLRVKILVTCEVDFKWER